MNAHPPDLQHRNKLTLLRGVALLPLLLYPWVLAAGIMAMAAPNAGPIKSLPEAIAVAFFMSALSYPITVVICLGVNRKRSLRRAAIPLWHLGLCLVLGVLWYAMG